MQPARYKPLSDNRANELITKLRKARKANVERLQSDIDALGNFVASSALNDIFEKNKEVISGYLKGEKSIYRLALSILFSGHFFKILANAFSIYRVAKQISKPEIQKALLENGKVLDFIGKNADICKELTLDALSQNEIMLSKTAELLTPGVFELLKDKTERSNFKRIILDEYMKFIEAKDLTKDEGYDFNYYSRSLYNAFSPDYLGLISKMSHLISQQSTNPHSLNSILNQHGAEITEEFAKVIEKDKFVDLPKSLSSNFNGPYATELNNTIVKTWENLDKEIAEEVFKKLTNLSSIDSEALKEEWHLFAPELINLIKSSEKPSEDLEALSEKYRALKAPLSPGDKTKIGNFITEKTSEIVEKTLSIIRSQIQYGENTVKILSNKRNQADLFKAWKHSTPGSEESLKATLVRYGITPEFLRSSSSLVANPADLSEIVTDIKEKPLFEWAETITTKLQSHHKLNQYVQRNPQIIADVSKKICTESPFIKDVLDSMGCDIAVLDIIAKLINDSQNANKLLHQINQGDYIPLIKNLLGNDEVMHNLKANKQLYSKLVMGLLGEGQAINQFIDQYKFDALYQSQNQDSIIFLIEHIISSPESLKKILVHYEESRYLGMARNIFSILQDSPERNSHADQLSDVGLDIINKLPFLRDSIRRHTSIDMKTVVKGFITGSQGLVGNTSNVANVVGEYVSSPFYAGYQITQDEASKISDLINARANSENKLKLILSSGIDALDISVKSKTNAKAGVLNLTSLPLQIQILAPLT